jgi:hypothetical protein
MVVVRKLNIFDRIAKRFGSFGHNSAIRRGRQRILAPAKMRSGILRPEARASRRAGDSRDSAMGASPANRSRCASPIVQVPMEPIECPDKKIREASMLKAFRAWSMTSRTSCSAPFSLP